MLLARFWVRQTGRALTADGEEFDLTLRGCSNESIEAAQEAAHEKIRRLGAVIEAGGRPAKDYLYGDRPMPEPILEEFHDGGAELMAAITRNSFGCDVLNTQDLLFADIDREDTSAASEQSSVARIQQIVSANGLSARAYRTAAGYRVLVTSARFEPGSAASELLMKQFDSDALYMRLCRIQKSFRARLTPKPWRCGSRKLKVGFPFTGPYDQERFNEWETEYNEKSAHFATCRFLGEFGNPVADGIIQSLVTVHDTRTKAMSGLPLA